MLRKRLLIFLLILLLNGSAFSCFKGAVITLEFPAGAENTALGEAGVSYAKNLYSVFWNPANLPVLYDETYSNIIYTSFREELLPQLDLDLLHTYQSFGVFLNDVFPYVDFGYSFFRNYIDMGESEVYDEWGNLIDTVHSTEAVFSNSFGLRAFDILSFGFSFKRFDSRLAPGIGGDEYPDNGIAEGRCFDVGFRIGKRLNFFDIFMINPSIGISFLSLGDDSADYLKDTIGEEDPLAKKMYLGGSCDINVLDLFEFTYLYDVMMCLICKKWEDREKHAGYRFQITPFYAILRGYLNDSLGDRHERSEGSTFSINYQKTYNAVWKIIKLIDLFSGNDRYLKMKEREHRLSVRGFTFKPNIYFTRSKSEIVKEQQPGIRVGQTRKDWSLGIGVIASFPNYFKKEAVTKDSVKEKEQEVIKKEQKVIKKEQDVIIKEDDLKEDDAVIEEEEGELVE